MNEQIHNTLQTEYFEKNDKKTMQPSDTPYNERHVQRVIEEGNISKQHRILDIGCGIGRYTLNFAKKGYQIEGLDIAPGLLEQLKRFNENVPLHCADIAYLPKELQKKYDVAVGFFALHHMYDLNETFLGVANCLKPGGRVIFLEPNPYNLLYYIQILATPKMTWKGDKGIVNMRRKKVFSAMENAGFSDLKLSRFGFFPPFIANLKGAQKVEALLENVPIWNPLLPFQIFSGRLK